jgi:hypothetical protein
MFFFINNKQHTSTSESHIVAMGTTSKKWTKETAASIVYLVLFDSGKDKFQRFVHYIEAT